MKDVARKGKQTAQSDVYGKTRSKNTVARVVPHAQDSRYERERKRTRPGCPHSPRPIAPGEMYHSTWMDRSNDKFRIGWWSI